MNFKDLQSFGKGLGDSLGNIGKDIGTNLNGFVKDAGENMNRLAQNLMPKPESKESAEPISDDPADPEKISIEAGKSAETEIQENKPLECTAEQTAEPLGPQKSSSVIKGLADGLSSFGQSVSDGVSGFGKDLGENFSHFTRDVGNNLENLARNLNRKQTETKDSENGAEALEPVSVLSSSSALKIIFCLMAADQKITSEEEKGFEEIALQIDPEYPQFREQLLKDCHAIYGKAALSESYAEALKEGVLEALCEEQKDKNRAVIGAKQLVWDLLYLSFADGESCREEKDLILFIVSKLAVNETELMELEQCFVTLMEIDKEISWLKTTDRPYLTIEAMVNSLEKRKSAVLMNAADLCAMGGEF